MEFKRKRTSPKIMIIPMIDIIFFLLVFFMISMLSMVHLKTLPVSLPASSTAAVSTVQELAITVTKDNKVYVENDRTSLEQLAENIKKHKTSGKQTTVILNADKVVPYGVVVAVMDQIKEAGISDITIATE